MLKGHVFSKQIFGNTIFALFINTFLNGKNGVSNNYKSGMAVTYSGSTLTVQSGAVCIQGRFLEEDTSTDIAAGTDTAYCKLVLEIDLSKENTDSEFNQASYKIVKSTSGYPTLTQNDIVKNNAGVYQYELARFKTGTNGITDFQDMRTFLDFESIYNEIEKHIQDIEDGSAFVLNKNIVSINTKITTPEANNDVLTVTKDINYPEGFNKNNTIVMGLLGNNPDVNNYYSTYTSDTSNSGYISGAGGLKVTLKDNVITLQRTKADILEPSSQNNIKITLMRIDPDISSYELGDVNGDGVIDETDLSMIKNYNTGEIALTEKQFLAADMNNDGKVSPSDYILLKNQLGIID